MRISFEVSDIDQYQEIKDELVENDIVCQYEKRKNTVILTGDFSKYELTVIDGIRKAIFFGLSVTTHKGKMALLNKIFGSASTEGTPSQRDRLVSALSDKYSGFSDMLNDYSYTSARGIMAQALSDGAIIQADYDLVDSILPIEV